MWFIGVEEEQETSAPPPKKNPGSAPGVFTLSLRPDLKTRPVVDYFTFTINGGN